jgi:hypothetical protein
MKMATSFRLMLRGVNGRIEGNFNMPGTVLSRNAVVNITAGQIRFTEGQPNLAGDWMYIRGDADVWVSNVSPHFDDHFEGEEGGVEYVLHVDWPDPLDVAVTFTVDDNEVSGYF